MITAIWLTIILVNIILSILHKNNSIIAFASAIVIVLLLGGNYQNADYEGYFRYYTDQLYPSSMEPGYVYLSSVSHAIGLTYQSFVLVLMSFSVGMTTVVILRYGADKHLIIALYLLTLFFLDAVQIRQTVAYSLFTVAIMLLSDGKRVLGAISIIVAFLFQWTAIVFFPLVFLDPKKQLNKKMIRWIVTIILFSCLIVFINGNSLSFLMPIIRMFVRADKLVYFDSRTRFGFVLYFTFQFACMYIAYICKTTILKFSKNEALIRYAEYIYMATMYACFALPFVMLNNNFSRIFKFSMMGCFILIANVYKEQRENGEMIWIGNSTIINPPTFSVIVVMYVLVYEIVIQLSGVVTDVLTYNSFF